MVPIPGGLTHPLTPGDTFDGQLISFTSDGSVGGGNARNLSRAIDYTPVDGTYYMSVLLEQERPIDTCRSSRRTGPRTNRRDRHFFH